MKTIIQQNGTEQSRQQKTGGNINKDLVFEASDEISRNKDNLEKAETAEDQMGVAAKEENQMDDGMDMGMKQEEPALKPRLLNLIIPIALLIPLSFILMWNSNTPSRMMLIALLITLIASVVLYLIQGLKLKTIMDRFVKGGNKLMTTIIILVLAWPISDVSQDLGMIQLIQRTLGGTIPAVWIPLIVFTITSAVTYFIGSSWGAWALMMPVAIPLAASTGSPLPLVIAAVLSGGTFGDVTSPVSGMTAMSSGISGADHMTYVRAMSPYNMTAAVIAAGLFAVIPFVTG